MYRCAECGASAIVNLGITVRSCECAAGIVADMQATAHGAGGVRG
jgi:hypothetical protein